MEFQDILESRYRGLLRRYLKESTEIALYQGQKFTRNAIEHQISPEEIINIHCKVMKDLFPEIPQEVLLSFDFLLEVMMGYGLAYHEHQSLRGKQSELRAEMEIAASVQGNLLETEIPQIKALDIGVISIPAKQMNGDYYSFVQEEHMINIAIADVIGKGMPAALCMSMLKYALDGLPESKKNPHHVLENLNKVVEDNVDSSMFITMLYGIYNTIHHTFTYASAGHEPGFYYHFGKNSYEDLKAKGLVLGVDPNMTYKQYEIKVELGDMIILLSDGVTETRTEEGFIDRSDITDLIEKYKQCSSQEMVENIYRDLEKIQNFEIRDDFTLIILKRYV
jgi:phosphoserine phosphatase RsbU/P